MMLFYSLLTTLVFLSGLANAFYLPGVAPTNYKKGDTIPLFVNHLTPSLNHYSNAAHKKVNTKTFVYSYDYYYPRFHFCKPNGGPKKQSESLGSIVFGDRIFNSPFDIKMLEEKSCEKLCSSTYGKTDAIFVNRNIRAGYSHNWIIDGLPAAKHIYDPKTNSEFYGSGFGIGEVDEQNLANLFNHFEIKIEYHKRAEDTFRVVGVTVYPMSFDRSKLAKDASKDQLCSSELKSINLDKDGETVVLFTYAVTFEESDTVWATRWDKYLHVYDPKIQWFSLINFSLIVIILGIIIAHILTRTLKNDISKYNEVNLDDEISDESGWKLVHGDVFRPPKQRMFLSVLVGSGVQIFLMILVTIVFALFGLLSPSNRGALSTFMFILYICFSIVSSFVSGYLYRFFGGENWKWNMILTPVLVPGSLFGIFVLLNFFLVFVNSSGAIPFGTLAAIVVIWFVFSIPLSIVGSILSAKRQLISVPVRTNQIPRQIPPQPWYLRTIPIMLMSGIFPFGSIAVEMYFIYSSLWFNKIFYMFGFLFFCFILMLTTTSLISILMIYYTLCSENFKWHWKSLFVGGGCAIYVFIHSLFLTHGETLAGLTSFVLYIGYSFVVSLLVFICCGSVGFLSSLFFVRKIYSEIKID
ncbi:transmembrane 9 superfamily member 1 [[Candida] anglica]|uniref:Transmembrane 9 superfamily member n=1 Tax=[Candida] anglica TaxID=148631 RepID=A0ABP0EBK9_9ASCO